VLDIDGHTVSVILGEDGVADVISHFGHLVEELRDCEEARVAAGAYRAGQKVTDHVAAAVSETRDRVPGWLGQA